MHVSILTGCGIIRSLHRYNGLRTLARRPLRYCAIALSRTRLDSTKARRFNPEVARKDGKSLSHQGTRSSIPAPLVNAHGVIRSTLVSFFFLIWRDW